MSALEIESLLVKMKALRELAAHWPPGSGFDPEQLYTVLKKIHSKILYADPLIDSRSTDAYSLFTAHLRRDTIALDDALDKLSPSTSFFSRDRHGLFQKLPDFPRSSLLSRKDPIQDPPSDRTLAKIAKQFEEVHKDLEMLLRLFSSYITDLLPKDPQQPVVVFSNPLEETFSSFQEPNLIGRKQDMENVLRILRANEKVVVTIVGMAGVGKTALIRAMYRAATKDEGFDYRLWVHVSQDFNAKMVFEGLIKSLGGELQPGEDPMISWRFMKERLLVNKKYLVVLDDVWNEDRREWKQLLEDLSCEKARESKIVVSTRIPAAAAAAAAAIESAAKYNLLPLSFEESLELLQTVTDNSSVRASVSEASIIRKVGERCSGLPILVDLARSFLKDYILQREAIDVVAEFDTRCMANMELLGIAEASYKHLPPHLQRCFLYCSLFPPDYIFEAEEMTNLWVAEGLISSEQAQMAGNISILLDECFEIFYNSESKGQTRYKMKFILHNLARNKGKDQYTVTKIENHTNLSEQSIRYMSLNVDHNAEELPLSLIEQKELRTLILVRRQEMVLCYQRSQIRDFPSDYCFYLTALRVLDLHATRIKKLPDTFGMLSNLRYLNLSQTDIAKLPEQFGKLKYLIYLNIAQTRIAEVPESIDKIKYLRYLNISQTGVRKLPVKIGNLRSLQIFQLSQCQKLVELPRSIGSLTNLQKLDLEGCPYLSEMPQDVGRMRNLKELNILECSSLDRMPSGISKLTKIEELPRYIATSGSDNYIMELQGLANLKRLGLENIGKISTVEAESIQLQNKHKLQHLALHFDIDAFNRNPRVMEKLFDILKPNHRLETLEVASYAGERFPRWISNEGQQLKNLAHVRLINLKCSGLQALGQLPHLTTLEISGMNAIEHVGKEPDGEHNREILTFPTLKKLTFSQMLKLESWPEDGATCPCLEELSIIQCPKFQKLSMELPIKKLNVWMGPHVLFAGGGLAGVVRSLQTLSISLCEELSSSSDIEGLKMLLSLEELEISGCDGLESFPPGLEKLTSLKCLSVIGCSELQDLSCLLNCSGLRSVRISNCSMLTSVPEGLRGITTWE